MSTEKSIEKIGTIYPELFGEKLSVEDAIDTLRIVDDSDIHTEPDIIRTQFLRAFESITIENPYVAMTSFSNEVLQGFFHYMDSTSDNVEDYIDLFRNYVNATGLLIVAERYFYSKLNRYDIDMNGVIAGYIGMIIVYHNLSKNYPEAEIRLASAEEDAFHATDLIVEFEDIIYYIQVKANYSRHFLRYLSTQSTYNEIERSKRYKKCHKNTLLRQISSISKYSLRSHNGKPIMPVLLQVARSRPNEKIDLRGEYVINSSISIN